MIFLMHFATFYMGLQQDVQTHACMHLHGWTRKLL